MDLCINKKEKIISTTSENQKVNEDRDTTSEYVN